MIVVLTKNWKKKILGNIENNEAYNQLVNTIEQKVGVGTYHNILERQGKKEGNISILEVKWQYLTAETNANGITKEKACYCQIHQVPGIRRVGRVENTRKYQIRTLPAGVVTRGKPFHFPYLLIVSS